MSKTVKAVIGIVVVMAIAIFFMTFVLDIDILATLNGVISNFAETFGINTGTDGNSTDWSNVIVKNN